MRNPHTFPPRTASSRTLTPLGELFYRIFREIGLSRRGVQTKYSLSNGTMDRILYNIPKLATVYRTIETIEQLGDLPDLAGEDVYADATELWIHLQLHRAGVRGQVKVMLYDFVGLG